MKNLFRFLVINVCVFIAGASIAHAGFGITPPYVKNPSLTRASTYEQEIVIVRSDPTIDLKAEISFDIPEANEWFTVDRGKEFLLAQGQQQVRMIVRVKVPEDAPFKNYKGNIRIRTSPADGGRTGSGAVSIALGAQIDVDLSIIDKKIYDFRIRKIQMSDLSEGHKTWWLDFPGKIKFLMQIESLGNVPTAPGRIEFSIYDAKGEVLLEKIKNSNRLTKVKPFDTKDVLAELPTWLPAGSYVARYAIYDYEGVKVVQEGEVNVSILPQGRILGDNGYGFVGLSVGDKMSILGPGIIVLLLLIRALIVPRLRRRR